MPFVFLALGLMLVVVGARNTQSTLFTLIESDMKWNGGFLPWILSIMAIGALGYYKPIKPISNAFLILIIIVLFISNKGVFSQFISQAQTPLPSQAPITASSTS